MEAIILAAGLGTRLRPLTENFPKPLLKVAGRELLYRHLHLLSEGPIEHFIIVINPQHEAFYREFLAKHPRFSCTLVKNPHPERGNGYSFFLAKDHVSGPFVLTMGDHVYEKDFVREALGLNGLVIDREGRFIDPQEATKALCQGGRVVSLGKDLSSYTGFDTGFFILEPGVFSTAEKLLREKQKVNLSEIMEKAQIPCSELSGRFWMDVDTPQDLRRATKLLIKTAVKESGDGFISRHLNRKVSTWCSSFLVDYLSPNAATLLTSFLGLLAASLLYWSPKAAALLYQLSSMLDGIDGEIARASLRESPFGGWLDSVLDRFVDFAFLLGLYLLLNPVSPWQQAVALLAFFGSLMVSYTAERFKGAFGRDIYSEIPLLRKLPGKRDERVFFIMICVLSGHLWEIFWVLALVTNLRVLLTLILVARKKARG